MATVNSELKSETFTRIFFERDLVLSHRITQRLHKRFYDRLDHSLFVSTKILREQHRDAEASRIESAARGLCDQMEGNLTQASERLSQTLAAAHIPSIDGHSDRAKTLKAEYSTGCSFRVLDLFSRLDQLLMQIEMLELHNVCPPEECTTLIRFWHGEFHRFINALLAVRKRPAI